MSDLSTFQITSFHTRLSFLDEENDDSLLDDDEVQEEEDEKFEDGYNNAGPAGNNQVFSESCWINVESLSISLHILDVSKDKFDRYLTQLLHSTTQQFHLPPIQRGQHHVFSAEHTTRDILSLMAQVQGLNMPREFLKHQLCLFMIAALIKLSEM